MTGEFYADQARRYSVYCRNYGDNKLFKIACGPNSEDYNWMEAVMRSMVYCHKDLLADRFISGVSLHYYTITGNWKSKGKALDADTDKWLDLMFKSWHSDELITQHKTIMDRYDPAKKIGLVFDEWGTWHMVEEGSNPGFLFQQNTIRDAVSASLHLDIFHKHADRLHMANLAQAVNVLQAPILTKDDKIVLTPTYHVLEMNKGHMDATNLPVFLNTENHQSEINGKSFSTLSMSASRKNKAYLLSVTNLDPEKDKDISIDLRGAAIKKIQGRILTADKLNSHNNFDKPNAVTPQNFNEFKLNGTGLTFSLPAHSFATFDIT